MKYTKRITAVCLCGVMFAACDQSSSSSQQTSASQLQLQTPKQDDESAKKLQKLKTDLFALQMRVSELESADATVNTEQPVYGIAKTNFGAFTVVAKSVTPYLDGFKVKLSFGNLTSAVFHGAKITVAWNLPYDANNLDAYVASLKNKEITVTNDFYSGAYTDVEVSLTPAKPEEVKSLSVGLKLDQLSMRMR